MNFRAKQNFGSWIAILFLGSPLVTGFTQSAFEPLGLTGNTFIHDPSTIIKEGTNYFVFATGPGIRTKSSPDLIHWTEGNPVFRQSPAWAKRFVPTYNGYAWAPDIIYVDGKYLLYYAASTWGKPISAIGLTTNPTLDQSATNYQWTDAGPVITSTNGSDFNTIDPSVFRDTDGKLWLAFGSYWEGIFLTDLNPQTGLRTATNSPLFRLAWNDSIEAACLTRHGNFYYLFVNWGQCCKGINSTYEVRMGRASKITGPYLDREGNDLVDGGGSMFLQSSGRFIGPGHIGIVADGGTNGPTRFSYHYYDAATHGRSRLAVGFIDWSDGWPVAISQPTNEWKLVWADEFNTNGPPNPANWDYERGFVRNEELQWYQPENAYCTNGLLILEGRREHKRNPDYTPGSDDWRKRREWIDYTSACLISRHLREFKYGKFEMRARIDPASGSWPAFWTVGATPGIRWPANGEVDIMEFYQDSLLANFGYSLDRKIKWLAVKNPISKLGDATWANAFHIWTMEWDEQKIDLLLDGKLMNHLNLVDADKADHGNPFHRPVYLLLDQAIGGNGGDPSQSAFPLRFEVDWVRVYQRDN